jgi:hypothetical protein
MATTTQPDLHQDCLDQLSHALDLVLKTAEAASAAGDQKLVLRSAREVSRLASLIHKMTRRQIKTAPEPRAAHTDAPAAAPSASAKEAFLALIGRHPADSGLPDLQQFFTPEDMVFWDTAPDHVIQDLGDKYQKWLNLEKAAAAELQPLNQKAAPPVSFPDTSFLGLSRHLSQKYREVFPLFPQGGLGIFL